MTLIVGLGSGRCGTTSLAELFARQPGMNSLHERKPFLSWEGERFPGRHFAGRQEMFADVGFYYLPYIEQLMDEFRQMRFICLKRDRQETIDSFCRYHPKETNWFHNFPEVTHIWDRAFPKYDLPFREAAGRYWDDYYERANQLEAEFDRFRIFPTESLNSEAGVFEILEFAGFNSPHIVSGLQLNGSPLVSGEKQ